MPIRNWSELARHLIGPLTPQGVDSVLRGLAMSATGHVIEQLPRASDGAAGQLYADKRRPQIWGHRGAMARAPENTHAAFQAAIADGADGVELDVLLARDSVPMVIHDDTLDRTTEGTGEARQFTSTQLAALDAGSWFGAAPEPIPHLADVYARLPADAVINVELKGPTPASARLEETVLALIAAQQRCRTIISSFHPAQLARVRELAPEMPIGLLVDDKSLLPLRTLWPALALRPDAIHPPANIVDADLVRTCHQAGMRVHVWRVKTTDDAERMIRLGVDALMVDDVVMGVSVRHAMGAV